MENIQIKNWEEKKLELKKKHPHLTDEDLKYEIGKEGDLLKRLQKKTGTGQGELGKWLHLMG